MWKSPNTIRLLGLWLPDSQRRTPGHYRALKNFSQTLFRVQESCLLRKSHTIQIWVCLKVIQFWSNTAYLHLTKQRIKNRNFLACLRADTTQPQNGAISSFSSISVYSLSNITISTHAEHFGLCLWGFFPLTSMHFGFGSKKIPQGRKFISYWKNYSFLLPNSKSTCTLSGIMKNQFPSKKFSLQLSNSDTLEIFTLEKELHFPCINNFFFFNTTFVTIALILKRRFIFKLLK